MSPWLPPAPLGHFPLLLPPLHFPSCLPNSYDSNGLVQALRPPTFLWTGHPSQIERLYSRCPFSPLAKLHPWRQWAVWVHDTFPHNRGLLTPKLRIFVKAEGITFNYVLSIWLSFLWGKESPFEDLGRRQGLISHHESQKMSLAATGRTCSLNSAIISFHTRLAILRAWYKVQRHPDIHKGDGRVECPWWQHHWHSTRLVRDVNLAIS